MSFSAFSCVAQEPNASAQHALRSSTELVRIEASILDKNGNFVGGLGQSSFRVIDNGLEQPIEFFAPVEAPAQVLVMLETSPAVYLIHNEHLTAAYALVEGLAPDDQVALVTYDVTPKPVLSFTADKSALLAALDKVQYTLGVGDLKLYDSLSTVLDWLALATGKKAVVLLTTGLDSSPPGRWDALVQKLRGEDVVIFPVALGGPLRREPGKRRKETNAEPTSQASGESSRSANPDEFAKADAALRSLATMTGGRAYFPQSNMDFAPMYHEIAAALRHQYVLGIAPAHDNQFHTLAVEVLGASSQPDAARTKHADYRVFARTGYLAPAP